MTTKREDVFNNLPGGTRFHSFALTGTYQPYIKTDVTYYAPFPFNAVFIGHSVGSGSLVLFSGKEKVEIDQYSWEL